MIKSWKEKGRGRGEIRGKGEAKKRIFYLLVFDIKLVG